MKERILDTDKFLYQFVGGEYHGKLWHYAALEARNIITGYSDDLSAKRAAGVLCKRAELDNQPLVKGYYPPMYNGTKEVDGVTYTVIRYESPEAYAQYSI